METLGKGGQFAAICGQFRRNSEAIRRQFGDSEAIWLPEAPGKAHDWGLREVFPGKKQSD